MGRGNDGHFGKLSTTSGGNGGPEGVHSLAQEAQ